MKELSIYETDKAAGKQRPGRTSSRVTSTEESSVGMELQLGLLWPIWVYKLEMKCEPPKYQFKSLKFNGQWIKGIIMPESAGIPIGVYKLTTSSIVRTAKEVELADSETAATQDHYQQVFKSARKKHAISVSSKPQGEDEKGNRMTKLLIPKDVSRKRDAEDVSDGL